MAIEDNDMKQKLLSILNIKDDKIVNKPIEAHIKKHSPDLHHSILTVDSCYTDFVDRVYAILYGNKSCLICNCPLSPRPSFKKRIYCTTCRYNPAAKELTGQKKRATMLDRYGVEYTTQSPELLEKIKGSNIKRYGASSPMKLQQVKDKLKATSLARYGTEHPLMSDIVRQKIKQTNLPRLGVEHPFESTAIQQKCKDTIQERYEVEFYSQTPEYKTKVQQTCLSRYGVKSYTQTTMFKSKVLSKMLGVNSDNPKYDYVLRRGITVTPEIADKLMVVPGKYGEVSTDFMIKQITGDITRTDISQNYSYCYGAIKYIGVPIETHISNNHMMIREMIPADINVIMNDRTTISPYELDIVIPSHNLAIEVNGTYWHSNKFKSDGYHAMKHDMAAQAGYTLLSFWDYDIEKASSIISRAIYSPIPEEYDIIVNGRSVFATIDDTIISQATIMDGKIVIDLYYDKSVLGLTADIVSTINQLTDKCYPVTIRRDHFIPHDWNGFRIDKIERDISTDHETSGILYLELL